MAVFKEAVNVASGFVPGLGSSNNFVEPYTTDSTNWYKSKPYGFAFYSIDNNSNVASNTIYLPIAPSNVSFNTSFATNVITTLYGIVEEHSEIRFYDIVIQGNTGIAPRYVNEIERGKSAISSGRKEFDPTLFPSLGGFLPEVTNTINQIVDTVSSIADAITGSTGNPTGLSPEKSGYAAFHNLYKFLHKYKHDAAGIGREGGGISLPSTPKPSVASITGIGGDETETSSRVHPLRFLNYKDGNQYDCVVQNFTLTRSADNPMLYHYNIKLRAFNLRSVDDTEFPAEDQLAKLGLGSLSGQSLFARATSVAGNAATLMSGLL